MVPPGTLPGGRYRLDSHIAAGGMGEVWRGTDQLLQREVAVKLLRQEVAQDPEASLRFRAEARHAALLQHPNIAQIFDFSDDPEAGQAYLVMELVDGPSLAKVLADGPVGPALAMAVTAQVSAGLAAAHAAGLVHRDIKPGNLLISKDGLVKITDFGIAHAAGAAPITRTGDVVGTVAYLAPERAAGVVAGPPADLYATGMVAYECLTGERPFTGDPLAVVIAHQDRPLPPLPADVPDGVAALVEDLTAKDPGARPGSAAEVVTRADRLRNDITDTTPGRPGLPPLAGAIVGTGPQPLHRSPAAGAATVAEAAEQDPLTRPVAGLGAGYGDGGPGRHEAEPAPGRGPFGWIGTRTRIGLAAAVVVLAGVAAWMLADQPSHVTHTHVSAKSHPVVRQTPSATQTPTPVDTAPAVAPQPADTPAAPTPTATPTRTHTTPPAPTPTQPPTSPPSTHTSPPPTKPASTSPSP
jgi:serine/threonine-protein kinase